MLLLIKRLVRGHSRTLPTGQVVRVAPYFDSQPAAQIRPLDAPGAPPPRPQVSASTELATALPGATAAAQVIAERFFPGHRLHLSVLQDMPGASGMFHAPAAPHLTYGAMHYVPPSHGDGPDLVVQVATTYQGQQRQPHELAWTLLHELGHAVQVARFEAAPEETRTAIYRQWQQETEGGADPLRTPEARSRTLRWMMPGSPARAQLEAMEKEAARAGLARHTAPLLEGGAYYHRFEEWFAERFAAWATHSSAPRSAIERFFSASLAALRDTMRRALALLGQPTPPEGAFERWAGETWRQAGGGGGGGGELHKALLLLIARTKGAS